MTRRSGAARIFHYNWPIFVGAWLGAAGLFALAPRWPPLALAGGLALASSLTALAVSAYVYDRSPLVGADWIALLVRHPVERWASVHAGLDAEVDADRALAGTCVARLDIFDRARMTSGSIGRARARTPPTRAAVASPPDALALADQSCDAVVVAFTAHELRDPRDRERLFVELRRALRPGGRVILVEHLRDLANFLAFGPGFLHFLPRAEWLRLAAHAGLTVAAETRITPWVTALALERAA